MSKSMNKVLALMLALVMVMGLAACGGSSSAATTATEAPAAENPKLMRIRSSRWLHHRRLMQRSSTLLQTSWQKTDGH